MVEIAAWGWTSLNWVMARQTGVDTTAGPSPPAPASPTTGS